MFDPEFDRALILDSMRAEYAFFARTLAQLTPEQMLEPNVEGAWRVKDALAHLTRWLRRMDVWFADARRGVKPAIPEAGYEWTDMDRMNDHYVQVDQDLPLDQVLADFRAAHADALALVESLSEHDLFASDFGGMFTRPPYRLVVFNTYKHYEDHLLPIRRWMAARGTP